MGTMALVVAIGHGAKQAALRAQSAKLGPGEASRSGPRVWGVGLAGEW